ncbi:MAG: glycosyltransferase family protein [Desulfovibrionaceae bacterium]
MRILNIDGMYFVQALRKAGHDVLSLGPQKGADVTLDRPLSLKGLWELLDGRAFRPELVLWCDICRLPSVIGFEALPAVTIGLSIDQYCNPWHYPYSAAFDLLLAAQKDYVRLFKPLGIHNEIQWAPLFCDPAHDKNLGLERDIPVSFVGTLRGSINTARLSFLQAFKRDCPLVMHQGEYVEVFNRSRIVVNQSAAGELNFRLFQAQACGAAVLTEDAANGLRELYEPGADVLVYPRGDAAAAARAARQALAWEGLDELARRGRRKALKEHSLPVRVKLILAAAERLARQGAPRRRLAALPAVRAELGKAYTIIAHDEGLPLPADQRRFFSELGMASLAG